ncbi:protein TIC 40, chloroplastic-like isoform X3 [Juglans microcarpa x Juglans regia]|uniref:protein TIC 40, chloroplastic-like isoform X3 n=1 Tax=Juglans microcarpa x Juglans regia TaxID=2249226 RepID=UPI001B7E6CF7|nr:protein TIC 40, chloroplastic-like isoform X3 [Juglans microcarpa x Juglans regia]
MMMSNQFLTASSAPPPYPKFQRGVGLRFRTLTRVFPSGSGTVKCLHRHPGLTWRARVTEVICAYGGDTMSERVEVRPFANISSSRNQETSSVGVNPQPSAPPSPSYVGSPLFWIGVGVGLSALFSWVATYLKKYAMQQAFKTLMGQMNSQNNQFNNASFSSGSPFPFPMPSTPGFSTSPTPATSEPAVTVDVPATNVDAAPATVVKEETEVKEESKKLDVSPEEAEQKSPYESFKDVTGTSSSEDIQTAEAKVSQNGAALKPVDGSQWSKSTGTSPGSEGSPSSRKPILSVEALEKMMEDPTVQKIVYPHLPEELRNPETFKWMLQNPQYRQQLEEMINNMMGGKGEWDKGLMDSFKDFDLNSPEVKQQFDQIGLSPEETLAKIMGDPELTLAFQNPRIQAAIMDCSQNPLSIAKYQNDKEVMDLFNKISQLFPGVSGPP